MMRGRALVVTLMEPRTLTSTLRGSTHRMRLFIDALGKLDLDITMAHFVTPEFLHAYGPAEALQPIQRAYWGLPVSLRLLPRRPPRPRNFASFYLAGILHAAEQAELYPFTGPDQIAAVASLLDEAQWDVVLVNRLPVMTSVLLSGRRHPAVLFDLDDLDHRVKARQLLRPPFWPGKLAFWAHLPSLLGVELKAARRSRLTFVCSDVDRWHLRRLGFPSRVSVVPNAVPVPDDPPPLASEPNLLFLGHMDYPPNIETAKRLATRVLPMVRREIAAARVLIAGPLSDRLDGAWGALENVDFLGFAPDLVSLYARSRVVCCPMDTGGGTRLKLVEAAAYARPIVATSIGAEGLDFRDGQEIFLRETDEAIASACIDLLRDGALAARVGRAARERMHNIYDAGRNVERLAAIMQPFLPDRSR